MTLSLSTTTLTWAVGIIIVLMLAIFGYLLTMTHEHSTLGQRVTSCEAKNEAIDKRFEDYLKVMDMVLAKVLRDWPSHMERDILMEQLAEGTLDMQAVERLDQLLKEAMREAENPEKELAFGMARARLTWLRSKLRESTQC